MSDVISLQTGKTVEIAEPCQSLIDAIKDLLEMAESGRLQSFVGTGFLADGMRVSVWADFHDNTYEMLGSIAWLQAEYIHNQTEGEE